MRDFRSIRSNRRLASWISALNASESGRTIPARSLYSGDHWSVARSLAENPPDGVSVRLWISSAGYGLVQVDDELVPYSATFSPGQLDSVIGDEPADGSFREAAIEWWTGLALRRGGRSRRVSRIEDIAATDPKVPLMITASPVYVDAMITDLLAASRRLSTPDLLSIFTSKEAKLADLANHAIPYDARLQATRKSGGPSTVGGAYPSLNIRATALAIATARVTRCRLSSLREHFEQLGTKQPPLRKFNRRRAKPSEVEAFVRKSLSRDRNATHSRLLREFRDKGNAFEYNRFRTVFQDVRDSMED